MRTLSTALLAGLTLTACTATRPSGDAGRAILTIAVQDGEQSVRFGAGRSAVTLHTLTLHGPALAVNDPRCVPDDPLPSTTLTCTLEVAVPGGKTFVLPSQGVQTVASEYTRDGRSYSLSTN